MGLFTFIVLYVFFWFSLDYFVLVLLADVLLVLLANVNSRSRSLYAVARPSVCLSVVCLSSVTLVHPTQAVQLFGNISTAFGTLAIR